MVGSNRNTIELRLSLALECGCYLEHDLSGDKIGRAEGDISLRMDPGMTFIRCILHCFCKVQTPKTTNVKAGGVSKRPLPDERLLQPRVDHQCQEQQQPSIAQQGHRRP